MFNNLIFTTMNATILKSIAKRKGVNLNYYGKVRAFLNDNYTKLYIMFYDEEGKK
jgi:hypothetical protein